MPSVVVALERAFHCATPSNHDARTLNGPTRSVHTGPRYIRSILLVRLGLTGIVLFLPPPHRSVREVRKVVASGARVLHGKAGFGVGGPQALRVCRHGGALRSAAASRARKPWSRVARAPAARVLPSPHAARLVAQTRCLMPPAAGPCRAPRRPTRIRARRLRTRRRRRRGRSAET